MRVMKNDCLDESKKFSSGFTLIELLVVIAIIGVLEVFCFLLFSRREKQRVE